MSSTPPIQFSGMASGLDTKAIVDALLAVESRGIARLEGKLQQTQLRQAALRDIRTSLVTLQQQAFQLTLSSNVNARSAAIASPDVLSATANAGAAKGTFNVDVKQLATSTKATSTAAIGDEIDTTAVLNSAGFATTVTFKDAGDVTGQFTINGKTVTISTATRLADVVSAINDPGTAYNGAIAQAGIGVTASIGLDADGRPNKLELTATGAGTVQLGATGDTTNFLSVAKLLGVASQTQQNSASSTLNVADAVVNDTTVTAIDVAGALAGDTFTFSYDAAADKLTLTRTSDGTFQSLTVGDLPAGGASTYSFTNLGVNVTVKDAAGGEVADDIGTNLAGKTVVTKGVVESQGNLGAMLSSKALSAARLETALTDTEGDFTINGKSITWKDTESLNSIISRINSAGAGVTASYDSLRDAIAISSTATGSQLISLADTTGNFLAATNLLAAAAQTAGQNAIYSIDTVDGGADLSSASNSVSDVVSGVTLNLKQVGSTQVTIDQSTSSTITAAKAFVEQFNNALNLIKEDLNYDTDTKTAGILFGDATTRMVGSRIRTLVSSQLEGAAADDPYQSLMDLGISFGKIGSALGTTNSLVLDESKLTKALQDNPDAVELVFKAFSNSATLGVGTGSIDSITGAPLDLHESGEYEITSTDNGDATATLSSVFTPTGGQAQAAVTRTIAAGATNSTLIRGVVVTATNPVQAGTDTITVTLDKLGVAHQMNDFLSDLIGITGIFKQRDSQADNEIKLINEDIDRFNERIANRRATLERQFAALESTLSSLQSQQASLSGQLSQLQGN